MAIEEDIWALPLVRVRDISERPRLVEGTGKDIFWKGPRALYLVLGFGYPHLDGALLTATFDCSCWIQDDVKEIEVWRVIYRAGDGNEL